MVSCWQLNSRNSHNHCVSSHAFLHVPHFSPSQDFSEDTYRTLAAADNAVMLVDAAKGLEPQTRKLFEVRNLTAHQRIVSCYLACEDSEDLTTFSSSRHWTTLAIQICEHALSRAHLPHSQCCLRLWGHVSIILCLSGCPLDKVCKLRELPIFTFVNKMDRPSLGPFELLDQIEREFGMRMAPVLWPIGDGDQFQVNYNPNDFVLKVSYQGAKPESERAMLTFALHSRH